MPTASIDTFFACALVVSASLLATGFFAGTMQTHVDSLQGANQNEYFASLAKHILTSCGEPTDWGSTGRLAPSTFGLAESGSLIPYEVDIDKISRLNSLNEYSLTYPEVSRAGRLNSIAFGLSVSPLFSVEVELIGNQNVGNATEYTFKISTSLASGQTTLLQCYALAGDFVTSVSGGTSSNGVDYVDVDVPNTVGGPGLLVVFARATFDERMTSFAVCSFPHLSVAPTTNSTFLTLSPLNHILEETAKVANVTIEGSYAFSYSFQAHLTPLSENTFAIPSILEKSPIILVAFGTNGVAHFAEWVSYPQLPDHFGADFDDSEANVFIYTVTIDGTLYKLVLSFGDVPK